MVGKSVSHEIPHGDPMGYPFLMGSSHGISWEFQVPWQVLWDPMVPWDFRYVPCSGGMSHGVSHAPMGCPMGCYMGCRMFPWDAPWDFLYSHGMPYGVWDPTASLTGLPMGSLMVSVGYLMGCLVSHNQVFHEISVTSWNIMGSHGTSHGLIGHLMGSNGISCDARLGVPWENQTITGRPITHQSHYLVFPWLLEL